MLNRHRAEIYRLESLWGIPPDGTAGTRNLIVEANATPGYTSLATVQSVFDALLPARDAFVTWTNTQLPADRQINAVILNPAAIYYTHSVAGGSSYMDASGDDGKGTALEHNLLVGGAGSDTMFGGAGDDVLVGLDGNDWLHGGVGVDELFGGVGDDFLQGGAGDDVLYGGAGDDTYVIDLRNGVQHDRIVDSDGKGHIVVIDVNGNLVNDVVLQRQGTANTWTSKDSAGNITATISHNSPWRLTLADGSVVELGEDFDATGFGITLQDQPAAPTTTYTGDHHKATNAAGTQYLLGGDGNYLTDGDQPGASDILTGSAGADLIQGLGGSDVLLGYGGDDVIEGGDGADVLQGGLGADTLNGGAGEDWIYGSSNGSAYHPTATSYTAPAPTMPFVFGQGFSWTSEGTGRDSDGIMNAYLSNSVVRDQQADDQGNTIDGGAGEDHVLAGTGSDVVHGGDDADDVYGMAGNDALYGDDGNDRLYGDGTVDTTWLYATAAELHGNDLLVGGAGNDVLIGQGGDDELYGGADDDKLWGDDRSTADTPGAVNGNDWLDGGDGADELVGGGRDDVLYGGIGNDHLWGDIGAGGPTAPGWIDPSLHGNDFLDGEAGNDYLQGEGGADTLVGGEGNDTLFGDNEEANLAIAFHGDDVLEGGAGDDVLNGQGGNDTLDGGDGVDTLYGDGLGVAADHQGNDLLDGGAGNDWLEGGGGEDSLFGGAGNDELHGDAVSVPGQYHGDDYLDGGDGDDRLWGQGGDDTLVGGAGADYLSGDDAEGDLALQFHGDDVLDGGDGNDTLIGGGGNDVLMGGAGADSLQGGAGNDQYVVVAGETTDGTSVDTIYDAQGSDTLALEGVDLAAIEFGLSGNGVLNVVWGNGQGIFIDHGLTSSVQTLVANGQSASLQQLVGERMATAVTAASMADGGWLIGGAVADVLTDAHAGTTVSGGRSDDTIKLNSAQGATVRMSLGDGTDAVSAVRRNSPTSQNVLELGLGINGSQLRLHQVGTQTYVLTFNDTGDGIRFDTPAGSGVPIAAQDLPFDVIRLGDGSTVSWQQIFDRGVPVLPTATEGDDVLILSPISDTVAGLGGNDRIEGLAGNDVLNGGTGNDTLIGGVGNDTLMAGTGSNVLDGGDGDDLLYGGDSNAYDVSEGGEGNDQYFFRFGNLNAVNGTATDRSTTSNDVYWVRDTGYVGGYDIDNWTINDYGGTDRLEFTSSLVTPANTTVRYDGSAITIKSWNLNVSLAGMFADDGSLISSRAIESVKFRDGTAWTVDQLRTMSLLTTAGGDVVHGYGGDDIIDGGAGNDMLYGGNGNDTLRGGSGGDSIYGEAGNDTLEAGAGGGKLVGGTGNDTYIARSGDGNVYVGAIQHGSQDDSGIDTLQLDVNSSAVTFSVEAISYLPDEDYLVMRWNDGSTTARALLEGDAATGFRGGLETIRFADGSAASLSSILAGRTASPTSGNDDLQYTSIDDIVNGGDGNDTLNGRGGDDRLSGGNGNDTLYGGAGDDVFAGGAGNDNLSGGAGTNRIQFGVGDGQDTVWSLTSGTNTLVLGPAILAGGVSVSWQPQNGSYIGSNYNVQTWNAGMRLTLANGADWVTSQVSNFIDYSRYGTSQFGVHSVQFQDGTVWSLSALVDAANRSTAGADVLFDAGGRDFLAGGDGNDALYGLEGSNRLEGQGGNDTLYAGDGDNVLVGGTGNDMLVGAGGGNTIEYARGDGDDSMISGQLAVHFTGGVTTGDVSIVRESFGTVAFRIQGGGSITANVNNRDFGVKGVGFADGTAWTTAQVWDKAFAGSAGDDHIVGFDTANDTLLGGAGNDVLEGGSGSDMLNGGTGDDVLYGRSNGGSAVDAFGDEDVLIGGGGNDRLHGSLAAVNYHFDAGFGNDTIERSYEAARDLSRLARVTFGSGIVPADVVASRTATGLVLSLRSSSDTVLISNFFASSSSSTPSANREVDQVQFSDGTVWNESDLVAQLTGAITATDDWVTGTASADVLDVLGGNDLVYAGAGNDQIFGRSGDDTLNGEDGDDVLVGGAGSDFLYGGAGNDRYEFNVGDGSDRIEDASGSADVLAFGAGIAAANVQVVLGTVEQAGQGYRLNIAGGGDTVYMSGIEFVRFQDGTEWNATQLDQLARTISGTSGNDVLTGTAYNDLLLGLAGNDQLSGLFGDDYLDGGAGNDTLAGGVGNDTYVVDSIGDSISESSNAGTDTVLSAVNWTLGSNIENLTLTGTAAINGTGNTLANILTGNVAANLLSGGSGADTMAGGAGDDTYVVDNAGDVVTELAGEGADIVQSSVTYTLGANVENLTLTGTSAINGTGNALDNVLTGNSAANVLTGGAGNDTYVVGTGDTVAEAASAGTDTVMASVTWTLGSNIENLILTGTSAISGTGNTLNNVITGNNAANTLDGGTGADTMIGGAGNDIYTVDNTADVITELAGEGTDAVNSSVTYILSTNVENLTLTGTTAINGTGNTSDNVLTGNSANNTLTGGAGNDTLDGGTGNDTMVGGAGNDTYVVNVSTDVVTELANEGTDTVQSGVTLTLGNNVENLTLTGTTAINGTGNTLDNVLTGNSAANVLTGGAGNDTYVVGTGDTVTEAASAGTDTVMASVTWTLGSNLENLTLTGTTAINGTGNTLDNVLTGNSAANTLAGAAGNDTYRGGAGTDTLSDTSTTSNDIYQWGRGEGADTLTDVGGTDRLDIMAGATADQIWLRHVGNNLEVSVIGTADTFTINGWYTSTANQVESLRLADGKALTASSAQQLVNAMAAFAPPVAGQTTLPANYQTSLAPVIAANWV